MIVLPRDDLQTEELVLEEVEVFRVRSHFAISFWVLLLYFIQYNGVFLIKKYDYFYITGSNSNYYYEDFPKTGKLRNKFI